MAIIALFSGIYCHSDEIADNITTALALTRVTELVFSETSKRFDISVDELRSALIGAGSIFGKLTNAREKHIACLRLVLAEMIQPDMILVEGCLSHLIPRTISHALRVCVIANHDYRLGLAQKQSNLSEKEADRVINSSDKDNFACTEFLFEKPAYDASLYDVILPMHDRSPEEAAAAICEQAAGDAVATTERSRRAARDFILAAQVGMQLAMDGLSADVHAEQGEVILSINKNVVRLKHYRESLIKTAEKVPGVKSASTRLGPRYRPASANPWSRIEGPPKFMLVDDEKEFVHTLSERLKTRNLEASIAYDGQQALEKADADTPDVIVLDLMMPGIDGIETLRRLKRSHPSVEVIILTGHGSEHEKREAEALGAFAYLRKPVDIDMLARVMREAYERAEMRGRHTDDRDEH